MQIQTYKNTNITLKVDSFLKNTTSTAPSRLHRFKSKVKWSNNVSPIHCKPSTMFLLQKQNTHPAKQLQSIIKKSQQLFHQERIKQKIKEKMKNIIKTEKENNEQKQQSKCQKQTKKSSINYLKNIYFEFVNQQLKSKAFARKLVHDRQSSNKMIYECPGTPARIHPRPVSAKKDFALLTPKNYQFKRLSSSHNGSRSDTLTPNHYQNRLEKSISSYRNRRSQRFKEKEKENKPISAKVKITKIPLERVFLSDLEPWEFSNEQI